MLADVAMVSPASFSALRLALRSKVPIASWHLSQKSENRKARPEKSDSVK